MTVSLDIANLSRLYGSGEATPEAIVREVYARIKAKGERPDWITLVDEDAAIEKARAAPSGPLHGVPFALKDNIDVAGLPTTCACPDFAYVAERSATVVDLLEQAGAILIGKTNLDQFATGLNGTRSPYGIPKSTFDPDYISGGSSSGSAVVVAAGLVAFALGTDTAGSGRIPAAFNNIVGFKPTKGLISMSGVVPACRTIDTVSILALTVADAAKVAAVAIAYDEEDAFARPDAPREQPLQIPRVGVPNGAIPFFGDRDYEQLYRASIDRMASLGAEIIPIDYAPFAKAAAMLYAGPWVAERLAAVGELATRNPEAIHEVVRGIILGARGKTAVETFQAFYDLAKLIREARQGWAKIDLLLLPTAGTSYKIAEMLAEPVRLNTELGTYTNFVNLMDLAAIAVPAGFRLDGIPFGVTLIGPALSDGMLAALGDALHRSLAGARLGATSVSLWSTPPVRAETKPAKSVKVAVVGICRASRSMFSSSSATRSSSKRRAPRPAIDSMRLPTRRPRSPAWCSMARVPEPSRWKSGRWTRTPSDRSSPPSRRRSASARSRWPMAAPSRVFSARHMRRTAPRTSPRSVVGAHGSPARAAQQSDEPRAIHSLGSSDGMSV
jgi:allophanate hydrolase